ncbi:MAG: 3-deoxy-7-phosphoheptulonate synthase [Bacteroidetes bacterium]|nr:MAG: 3-deoxy-7-phosphoheptulonate synthase [Bacteroidota bacterium]
MEDLNSGLLPIEKWGIKSTERPVVIAGPCSAESEKQVLDTAKQLSENGIQIYRAGIWKPRTRPGNFEGVGAKGLPWLKKVKEETGMLTTTEVATEKHVYEALKFGVDILWIGARSSANPFVMQEIANALEGADVPVMIKNPINPDLDLWIGAIERIQKAGIKKIAAIHRGFSTYDKSLYRNIPQWQIAIDLKLKLPNIPLINDPSHIGGKRELLFDISQKAMDLHFDGLMIESHINPDEAWSDAKQQITPAVLEELLRNLILRDKKSHSKSEQVELDKYRAQIDSYDNIIMGVLGDRMDVVKNIGKFKKENNITILQPNRWDQLMKKNYEHGDIKGFSRKFVDRLFKAIHQESINFQTEVMKEETEEKIVKVNK